MSDAPQRLDHVRRTAIYGGLFAVSAVAAICVVAAYIFVGEHNSRFLTILIGVGVTALAAFFAALYLFIRSLVDLVLKLEANTFRIYDTVRDLTALQNENQKHLSVIAENVQLTDTVRSIMHRDRERTALRLAINEEIIRGDLEAAYALVEQLEARHGYKNEAARLRKEVDLSSQREQSEKVHEAVVRVHTHLDAQEWDPARRAMDRLLSLHPDNSEVRDLPRLFTIRRSEHKRRLLKEWDDAVQRNEVDRGIAILRELDQYLTKNEAAALQESARGVFRTKLHNLGLQFSLAVTEHNWRGALDVGREIISEFPNSRMAAEVRERMHVLSKRAIDMSDEQEAFAVSQE